MIRVSFRWLERGYCRHPEAATMRGGSLCATKFPAMVGVITHPTRGLFLFDTGYDPAFIRATHTFPERVYRWTTPVTIGPKATWQTWLIENAIDETLLTGTILSHFHGDHVAGMAHLRHLPVYCARAGLEHIRSHGRIAQIRQGFLPSLIPDEIDTMTRFFEDAPVRSVNRAFAPFTEGRDILGDGSLLAIELPGHCAGHWGLALKTETDQHVLLAADAVWSIKALISGNPPPKITTSWLGKTKTYRQTFANLRKAMCHNPELHILPSHCATSAADFGSRNAN